MPEAFERIGYGTFSEGLTMGMPRYAATRDGNHTEVVKRFESWHASVLDLSKVGGGCPDLLIGLCGKDVQCEVKPGDGTAQQRRLRPKQAKHKAEWKGRPVEKIESVADVDALCERIRRAAYAQARKGVET